MSDFSSQQQKGNGRGHHPNSIATGTANLIPYPPGQSGNPGGNYKHTPKFRNAYERLLQMPPEERAAYQPVNGVEELALAQIQRAVDKGIEPRDQINATEKVIDRVEGKAPQTINQNMLNITATISAADFLEAARALGLPPISEEDATRLIEIVAEMEGE